jgi:hypothetical protein
MHGLGHDGSLRKCIWAPTQEVSILSQTHYQRRFPNTMFVQYYNKACIIKVNNPASNSIIMLHKLGHSGRKVAFFISRQGSYIRKRYQFIYDMPDYAMPTPPGFDQELDKEVNDSQLTVNMMDASSKKFDVSDVAAAFKHAQAFSVLRHEKHSIALGLTVVTTGNSRCMVSVMINHCVSVSGHQLRRCIYCHRHTIREGF